LFFCFLVGFTQRHKAGGQNNKKQLVVIGILHSCGNGADLFRAAFDYRILLLK